jgi:hypothetical protein
MRRVAAVLALLVLAARCGGDGGGPGGEDVRIGLSGQLRYQDKVYGRNGFTGQTQELPIRHALVQLVDSRDKVLAETVSDAQGAYSLEADVPEGSRIRLVAAALSAGSYNVRVTNAAGSIFSLAGPEISATAGTRTQDLLARASDVGGPFNILDEIQRGSDFVRSLQRDVQFAALRVVWDRGSTDGTYFRPSNDQIHLLGESSDTDEYDDDVILHEFGHYVAHHLSWDTSPGGPHNPFDDIPEPPALAWSEGYAHWFSALARDSSGYVDTNGRGALFFDIEPPSAANVTVGEGNELAVGAILWDLSDPPNEPHDTLGDERVRIWDVTHGDFRARRPADATLREFCAGWHGRGHGRAEAVRAIFAHRRVSCP